jgi:L-glutamine-phosphate cytidylyltransferase
MDALILAAGRGSRLGGLTDDRPKCLIDLGGGVTPLRFQAELLLAHGVERVAVVTGYRSAQVMAALHGYLDHHMEITEVWNPFWSVTNVIGSAWMASGELRGPFVYLHADTVFDPGILADMVADAGEAVLPIDFRPCEPEQMKAEVTDASVLHLSKDLPAERTAGEFIGIALFRGSAVEMIRRGMDNVMQRGGLGEYFEAAVNSAIDAGLTVTALPTGGRAWTEIDFPEDLALAKRLLPAFRSEGGM